MKTSKHTGERTVRQIDSRTLLVTDHDGTGSLYDLQRVGRGWGLQKIDADGAILGETYFVHIGPDRCTCKGHKYGYSCRHIAMLTALLNRGTVAVA